MKRIYYLVIMVAALSLSVLLTSCRPPELEGAIVHLNAGRDDQAYELAKEATEKYPDNAEAWYYLGQIQGKRGDVKEMMESFDKSLAVNASFEPQIQQARNSYFGKFYNEGVSAYNTYLKMPDREIEAAKEQLNSIIDNFQKSLLIKPDFMANRLISVAYQNLGDDEKSLEYLLTAAEVEPDTSLAWLELGYFYSRKKEYDKASENFKKALELDPENVDAMTMYAQNLDFANRREEAIAAYKSAMEKNPEEKAIPFNLGLLLNKQATDVEDETEKQELLEESAKYFKKAHELDPDLQETYEILSSILLQLGKYDEAEQYLLEAVERFPDSASIWQNLSFMYAKQGKKKEAEEAYEKSQALRGAE